MKTLLFLLLFISVPVVAQELSLPVKLLSNHGAGPEQYVGTDAFGAVYTTHQNELRKLKEGVVLKYQAVSLGEISRIDLQNPLQIVLFYRKFNTVVLLDNQLNETSRTNFSNIPEPLIAEAAGLATQNRLWIYDITTQRLGLYDLAQASFKPLTPPFTDPVKYYQTDYNYFYWIDGTGKCFAANLFGKVTILGNVPQYEAVHLVSSTEVLVQKDNALYLYNLQKNTRQRIDLVEKSFNSFKYSGQILTIFTDTHISQYQIIFSQ